MLSHLKRLDRGAVSAGLRVVITFFLVALSAAAPAQAGDVAGETFLGSEAIYESTADIMARQAAIDALGIERPIAMKEEFREDRSGLPLKPGSPEVSQWPPLEEEKDAAEGERAPRAPQTLGTPFNGATLSLTSAFPADTMGAAGPTQFLTFVNGIARSVNKNTGGGDGVLLVGQDTFWNSVRGGAGTSDPRIRFDRHTQRWFGVIITVVRPNRVLLVVSDTAVLSASTVWSFFFFNDVTVLGTCLADYPTLGIDQNALYIGATQFCPGLSGRTAWVINKASMLSGGPIQVTRFDNLTGSPGGAGPGTTQGVDSHDVGNAFGWFVGADNQFFGSLVFRRISNPGSATPTMSGNLSLTVPATSFPFNAPHTSSPALDTIDDRLFAAHLRNGRIWTAHHMRVNSSGVASGAGDRNGARWYEIDVASGTPFLTQSGTIWDPTASNPRHYIYPAIMVSGQGHAAIGTSTCGTGQRINAFTTGRLVTDPLGTMQNPGDPALSPNYTNSTFNYNTGVDRWGDYSYTCVDPTDDMTMWTIQKWCHQTGSYACAGVRLIAPPPTLDDPTASVQQGTTGATINLTGTGFYDPAPAIPNHLSVALNGGAPNGISNIDATWNNATSVTVTFDVSAGAEIGARDIVLTNPDGQVVTVVGGLTITPDAMLGVEGEWKRFE